MGRKRNRRNRSGHRCITLNHTPSNPNPLLFAGSPEQGARSTGYAQLRRHLEEVFHNLARQKESTIEEGHLLPDHVHMLIAIRPNRRYRR